MESAAKFAFSPNGQRVKGYTDEIALDADRRKVAKVERFRPKAKRTTAKREPARRATRRSCVKID